MTVTPISKENKFVFKPRPTPPSKFVFIPKQKSVQQKSVQQNPVQQNPVQQKSQYSLFVELCNKHSLPYFQFYDEDSWKGPVTKVSQEDFNTVIDIFEAAQDTLKTIVLHGYGFVIIKPIHKMDDNEIHYPVEHCNTCQMTQQPIIPYNSDMEESEFEDSDIEDSDADADNTNDQTDSDIIVEEEFIAEEWKYNNTIYLLDTSTNYVYSPSTLEFVGKKTSEFSIDYDAKEC